LETVKAAVVLVAALIAVGVCTSSEASYFNNYGDLSGDTVTFYDVTESTFTHDVALYGTPSTIGDTLRFELTNFGQYVSGGDSALMDGMLETTIASTPGTWIDTIRFAEYGDVSLSGTGGVDTYAAVSNAIFLKITEVDGVAANVDTLVVSTTFSPSNGDWNLADDGVVTGLPWEGVLFADLDNYLQTQGFTGHATEVHLTMDNVLNNGSEIGKSSFIRKKETDGIEITPYIIPEPATFLILGIGGALLTLLRRGKKA
jgi:archaellum component FlaF (FlaF/FlaG flagellin family)